MPSEQPEFDFSAPASMQGYHLWRSRMDQQLRALESRYGIILTKPVEVLLRNHDYPVRGILRVVNPEPSKASIKDLKLRLNDLTFGLGEVLSISRAD